MLFSRVESRNYRPPDFPPLSSPIPLLSSATRPSLIFLARVGPTIPLPVLRVSLKSDDTSNRRRDIKLRRGLTRLPGLSVSLRTDSEGRGRGKICSRAYFFFFEGRERSFGIRRRIERERESTRFKSGNSGYIRLFARDFSVDTGLVALDSEASTDYARNCIQILFLIPSTRPPFLSITFNRAPTIAL